MSDSDKFFNDMMEALKRFSDNALLYLLLMIGAEVERRKKEDDCGGGCYVETREGYPQ